MAKFDKVLTALTQGQSVRRENWQPEVHMFVHNDSLMYQHGDVRPWQCALSWDEIAAADWQLLKIVSGARQAVQIAAERPHLLLVEELALPKSFGQVRAHYESQSPSFSPKSGRLLR
jgi:hypothetical protein